jgi:hypothetical protein
VLNSITAAVPDTGPVVLTVSKVNVDVDFAKVLRQGRTISLNKLPLYLGRLSPRVPLKGSTTSFAPSIFTLANLTWPGQETNLLGPFYLLRSRVSERLAVNQEAALAVLVCIAHRDRPQPSRSDLSI